VNETWELWYPDAGATGIPFARSRIDGATARDRVLVHAAPRALSVTVRNENEEVVAEGKDLKRTQEGPMSYLLRDADRIWLQDVWPTEDDIGRVVLLPGGEAGTLVSWWHAPDHSEWRWQVEFTNHR
jgi:hypothetical protein